MSVSVNASPLDGYEPERRRLLATRIPLAMGSFVLINAVAAAFESHYYRDRVHVVVPIYLIEVVICAITSVGARRAPRWAFLTAMASTYALVLCHAVYFLLTGSPLVHWGFIGALLLCGLAVFYPWGWRWQLGAAVSIFLGHALINAGGVPAALPGPYRYFPLSVFAAVTAVGAAVVDRQRRAVFRSAFALKSSEATLRDIFENVPDVLFQNDLDDTIRIISPSVRQFGYAPEDLIGQPSSIVYVDPAEQARVRTMLFEHGSISDFEVALKHKDGTVISAAVSSRVVRDSEGHPLAFEGTIRDIRERKRAEDALKLHSTIVGTMAEGVCVVRAADAVILYANARFEVMFGYGHGELQGKPVAIVNAGDAEAAAAEIIRALKATGAWRGAIHNRKSDGTAFWCQVTISTFPHSEHGDVWVAVHTDITERKHADEMRQRHQRETTIINDILQAINTHLDVQAAFPAVCAGLRELASCAAVSLNLFDARREWLTFVAADAPWAFGVNQGIHLAASEFPAISDALAGRPHVVGDLATELHFPLVEAIYQMGLRSVVALPLCIGSDVVGILNLFWREVNGCHGAEMAVLSQVTNAVAIAVEKTRLFDQVSAGHQRLAALSRRLLEVHEIERRHLARELHDEIGQYLTGISLVLRQLENRPLDGAGVQLAYMCKLVDDLIARVRDLSLDLRPAMLDDFGLLQALLWLVARVSTQMQMRVDFEHRGINGRFPQDVETGAYRIVQEALTNVARHAGRREARVEVTADHSVLSVTIADRGSGFDVDAVLANGVAGGLTGMRERAALLGGRLLIESALGAGTRLRAELPLQRTAGIAPCP